jgi:hypothetical protein
MGPRRKKPDQPDDPHGSDDPPLPIHKQPHTLVVTVEQLNDSRVEPTYMFGWVCSCGATDDGWFDQEHADATGLHHREIASLEEISEL